MYAPNTVQYAPCPLPSSHRDGGPAPGSLPLELDAFVGRSAELAGLVRALRASRLVTVTGTGGVGTSRLAARAAARSAPPGGAWPVDLAPVRDPEFVECAVVEALGLTDHTTRLPRETLLAHLAAHRLLLVSRVRAPAGGVRLAGDRAAAAGAGSAGALGGAQTARGGR
ncbi:hypothetical protein GCM10010254_45180 [Streptomyces chromofuscus]|nr:hypothetical protein GCM10010254_45180 [Streptomyces chromofuscus]